MIEVNELTKVFENGKSKRVVAVNKINFSCEPGRIVGILGPNGAGKTTTLRMIATILTPTSGTATINGYDVITHADQVRSSIGFLTGETGLYTRLTPRETLHYFGQLNEMNSRDINKRIEELSEIFGMNEFLDDRIYKLSTGMKQKVSLSRTMIPVMNTTFVQQELLMGIINWPYIGLTVLTTGFLTIIAFMLAVYSFLNERILFRQ